MTERYKKELDEFLEMIAERCPANLTEEQMTQRTKMLTDLFARLTTDVVWAEDELEDGKQAMQYDYSVIRERLNAPESKTLWQKIKRLHPRLSDWLQNLMFPDSDGEL